VRTSYVYLGRYREAKAKVFLKNDENFYEEELSVRTVDTNDYFEVMNKVLRKLIWFAYCHRLEYEVFKSI